MREKKPKYDDSNELKLNALICSLDENPKLNISPVEGAKYLDFSLAVSEEGFQQHIEKVLQDFTEYLNVFAKSCIDQGVVKTVLSPTISRILTKYKQAQYTFTHSPLRLEWLDFSENYVIPNSSTDFNLAKEQNYTRQVYKFFYKCSSIQLYFVEKVIDDLMVMLDANGMKTGTIYHTAKHKALEEQSPQEIKQLHFTIQPNAKSHSHDILQYIHKELKEAGYIDCNLPSFKKVFMSEAPSPIIWLKPYNHLSYFIKSLGGKFIDNPYSQSNMEVARRYFYNKKYGVHFTGKVRHDKDPANSVTDFFDGVIRNSVDHFIE